MRETEFRGKSLQSGKWFYGSLITYQNASPDIYDPELMWHEAVDPETVGQWSGLRDKNGVEIYEGDIVKVWDKDSKSVRKVTFGNTGWYNTWGFGIKSPEEEKNEWNLWRCVEDKAIEVIGNTYENPELVEAKHA